MASFSKPATLQVGDRVRERKSLNCYFAQPGSANYRKTCSIAADRRQGRIVEIETRVISNGRACTYLHILWDGATRATPHARQRIELASSATAVRDTLP